MNNEKFYLNNLLAPDYYLPRGMDLPEEKRIVLNLEKIYQNSNPLVVEIGFGNGEFLVNLAQQYPDKNFLGIELSRLSIHKLDSLVLKNGLKNIRYFFMDAKIVFNYLLPLNSVSEIYINFPDPWPKKRHHKHRFIQPKNLEYLLPKLEVGGKINFVTDDWPYAVWAYEVFSLFSDVLANSYFPYWYKNQKEDFYLTKYARKWLAMGKKFYFQQYEKVSS